jgi:hypothetical protein
MIYLEVPPAPKLILFLRKSVDHERSSSGIVHWKSQTSQVTSALESLRVNWQHEYQSCPETQNSLQTDTRIRQLEASAKHDEPKRAEKAQITKAARSSSGISSRCPFHLSLS